MPPNSLQNNTASNTYGKIAQFANVALLGTAVFLAFLVYQPGMSGVFLMDDTHVLKSLNSFGGVTDTSTLLHFLRDDPSGPTGRPISMLALLLDDQYWPGDPGTYRHTNLLIHLICGLLVALLSYKAAIVAKTSENTAAWIGALTAMVWLLHPLNTSTTLYIAQRMTQLSALFVLTALILYTYGRLELNTRPVRAYILMTLAIVPTGLLAVLSKENGALLPLFIISLETTIYRGAGKQRLFYPWLTVFVALPVAIMTGYVFYAWESLTAGFHLRDFSLSERLLTEPRVLIDYLTNILVPHTSGTGLFHDDFLISRSLTSPTDTLPAIIALLAILISAIWLRKSQPVYSFAALWFIVGHAMESSFLNLEIYFEHRNYLPMVGPLFAVSYYLASATGKLTAPGRILFARALVFVLVMAPMSYLSLSNAKTWGRPHVMFPKWAEEHPLSLNARIHLAAYLEKNGNAQGAMRVLEQTYIENPQRIDLALYAMSIACTHNVNTEINPELVLVDVSNAEYSGGFTASLSDLITSLDSNTATCKAVDRQMLHEILHGLQQSPSFRGRSYEFAMLLLKHAQLYISEGNLGQSMTLLDEARKRHRGVAIPLYQAQLLYSAGLHEAAQEYVTIARTEDENRPFMSPSRIGELDTFSNLLENNGTQNDR